MGYARCALGVLRALVLENTLGAEQPAAEALLPQIEAAAAGLTAVHQAVADQIFWTQTRRLRPVS